ncbi:MAG: adenosylcobinamide-GDP ribazoletransferase [Desulfovibrio sp.]|nr:adenosylcobinamide-GDP ribazoletransferase [Desulfovibrio sp.]
MLRHLRDALSFFCRLFKGSAENEAAWQDCVPYFFLAGLVFGAILLGLSIFLSSYLCLSLPASWQALFFGLIWLGLEIWLSRALHFDGLADLTDALGAVTGGGDFWQVLRDSRLGSFGCSALILVIIGQWLLVSAHAFLGHYLIILLAPAWSRSSPLWLAYRLTSHPSSKLGRLVTEAQAQKPSCQVLYHGLFLLLPPILALYLGQFGLLLLWPSQYFLLKFLRNQASLRGGLAGDFFGAAIELSQLIFLLTTLSRI